MDTLKQLDGDAMNSPGYGQLINRAEHWKALHRSERGGHGYSDQVLAWIFCSRSPIKFR